MLALAVATLGLQMGTWGGSTTLATGMAIGLVLAGAVPAFWLVLASMWVMAVSLAAIALGLWRK